MHWARQFKTLNLWRSNGKQPRLLENKITDSAYMTTFGPSPLTVPITQQRTHMWEKRKQYRKIDLGINYILREITEGRMKDKAFRTRKRLVIMLSGLASSPKYQEVKKTAEDREGWTAINGREMPWTCLHSKPPEEEII